MMQKTITEQRWLFHSEGLDQGDCLKEGHYAMASSMGRAQTSPSSHEPQLYPNVLLTLYRMLLSCFKCSLFSVFMSLVCGRHIAPLQCPLLYPLYFFRGPRGKIWSSTYPAVLWG